MQPSSVADLFASILLGGVVAVAASAAVPRLRTLLDRFALPTAAAVASAAMAGSLYFSEIADFVPCKLCWFQRIVMYPLAALLVLASIWRDRAIFRYVVPLAVVGMGISGYHVWVQLFPERSNFCELDNPCSAKWVEAFGVLTIPQMAGISFALITTLGALTLLGGKRSERNSGSL